MGHYTLKPKAKHKNCYYRLEMLWVVRNGWTQCCPGLLGEISKGQGILPHLRMLPGLLKFIKPNIPNAKATGDSRMTDSEVQTKVLHKGALKLIPTQIKRCCSKDKVLCKYFPTISTGTLFSYKNVLQTKFKTTKISFLSINCPNNTQFPFPWFITHHSIYALTSRK